jgi:hypothetical protein
MSDVCDVIVNMSGVKLSMFSLHNPSFSTLPLPFLIKNNVNTKNIKNKYLLNK